MTLLPDLPAAARLTARAERFTEGLSQRRQPCVAQLGRSAGSQPVVSQRPALLVQIYLRSDLCRSNTILTFS